MQEHKSWPDLCESLLDKLEEVLGITAGHTTPDGVFTLNAQNSAC